MRLRFGITLFIGTVWHLMLVASQQELLPMLLMPLLAHLQLSKKNSMIARNNFGSMDWLRKMLMAVWLLLTPAMQQPINR